MDKDFRNYLRCIVALIAILVIGAFVDRYLDQQEKLIELQLKQQEND